MFKFWQNVSLDDFESQKMIESLNLFIDQEFSNDYMENLKLKLIVLSNEKDKKSTLATFYSKGSVSFVLKKSINDYYSYFEKKTKMLPFYQYNYSWISKVKILLKQKNVHQLKFYYAIPAGQDQLSRSDFNQNFKSFLLNNYLAQKKLIKLRESIRIITISDILASDLMAKESLINFGRNQCHSF